MGRRKKMTEIYIVAGAALLIGVFLFFFFASETIGLDANTAAMFLAVLPGLMVFFFGASVLVWQGVSLFALPGFAILGAGAAVLIGEIEDSGLYPLVTVGGPTLAQYQWIAIILCTLVGCAVAAASRR